MLFHVHMEASLPHDLPPDARLDLLARERARAAEIQRAGKWPHLWRIVGETSNISVFDVESPDELHDLLSSLPMFAHMRIKVTPLAQHPSKVH